MNNIEMRGDLSPLQIYENPVKGLIGNLAIADEQVARVHQFLKKNRGDINFDVSLEISSLEQALLHLKEIRKLLYEARTRTKKGTAYNATVKAYVDVPITITAEQLEAML